MSAKETVPPGSVYRLVVRSAEEAVQTIRERFGAEAKVLSVQQQAGQGLSSLFSRPKLEVVVQVGTMPALAEESVVSLPQEEPTPEAVPGVLSTPAALPRAHPYEPAAVPRHQGMGAISLSELLRRAHFSETMLSRLGSLPSMAQHESRPLHVGLSDLGRDIRRLASGRRLSPLPARTAFLGSCGVGRTTALCKWLAAEVCSRNRSGRVLKVGVVQPTPAPDLDVFCEALGMTLEHYSPEVDLGVPDGGFLYADMPGLALNRPEANRTLGKFLDAGHFDGRVLVLHALYDHAALRAAYAAGRELGATHLVFTHCDELAHWGKLMDYLIDGELTPLFLATGPSLSGDCLEDTLGAVLSKTLPGA